MPRLNACNWRGLRHLHGKTWEAPQGFDHFAIMRGLGEYKAPEIFTNDFAPFKGRAVRGHSSAILCENRLSCRPGQGVA